jgi:hypothetical protein
VLFPTLAAQNAAKVVYPTAVVYPAAKVEHRAVRLFQPTRHAEKAEAEER